MFMRFIFQNRRGISSLAIKESIANHKKRSCWNCGMSLQTTHLIFCGNNCGAIQPVDPMTCYFNILLPALLLLKDDVFDLDNSLLRKRYLELASKVHPDLFVGKDDISKKYAIEQSVFINKAYNILKDPLTRGMYLVRFIYFINIIS